MKIPGKIKTFVFKTRKIQSLNFSSTWDISPLSLTTRGDRKSAFLPYKPTTVLTNLQRGNTEASIEAEVKLTFHERSGQGEITEEEALQQINIDILDSNYFTPLHYSCYYGQFSSASILIKCVKLAML